MTAKTAPRVCATIVGRSVVRVLDSTRQRPSRASWIARPSATAMPAIQRSATLRPGSGHRVSPDRRSRRRAEYARGPDSGWCRRRPNKAPTSGASTRLVMVPSYRWRAWTGITRSAPCSSAGRTSRSSHSPLTDVTSASRTTSARTPSRRATPTARRSAAPRPGTPWNGTAPSWPAGASCFARTSGSRASDSRSTVASDEPASALIRTAGVPAKCFSRPLWTAFMTAGTVAALLYVKTPTASSAAGRPSSCRSTSGGSSGPTATELIASDAPRAPDRRRARA